MSNSQRSISESSETSEEDEPHPLRQIRPYLVKKYAESSDQAQRNKRRLIAQKLNELNETLRVHGK